ncbi:MAG: NPCBM/NEW2 domain-containing protein [Anaerovorax sp.]
MVIPEESEIGTVETTKISYMLNKEYKGFMTTFGVRSESYIKSTVMKIYGDDKLLYTSPGFTEQSKAYDVNIDVSGVSVMTIEFELKGGQRERTIILGEAKLLP